MAEYTPDQTLVDSFEFLSFSPSLKNWTESTFYFVPDRVIKYDWDYFSLSIKKIICAHMFSNDGLENVNFQM